MKTDKDKLEALPIFENYPGTSKLKSDRDLITELVHNYNILLGHIKSPEQRVVDELAKMILHINRTSNGCSGAHRAVFGEEKKG